MEIVVIIAAVGTVVLTPIAAILARKYDAVSRPDRTRRKHVRPTPQWGGTAVYLAMGLSIAVSYFCGLSDLAGPSLPAVVALSAGLLCLLGGYDDLVNMRAYWKLLGQIVAIIPVIFAGYYAERFALWGFSIELGWMGIVWTIAWLILGINALNLIDGVDGLATVIGIVISLAVAVIAGSQGLLAVVLPALALAGALVGFAVYNFPPARIYLGDSGSMVVGFVLSLLAMQVSLDGHRSANLTIATVLLFVPLLDTALAVIRRVLSGRSIMTADRGHIHHRLLDRGFNTWSVLAFLGGLSLLTGAAAWLMTMIRCELWMCGALGALNVALINRQLVGHKEWAIARRSLSQGVLQIARRLTLAEHPTRLEASASASAWKTIHNHHGLPEAAQTIPFVQEDDTWTASENKAA